MTTLHKFILEKFCNIFRSYIIVILQIWAFITCEHGHPKLLFCFVLRAVKIISFILYRIIRWCEQGRSARKKKKKKKKNTRPPASRTWLIRARIERTAVKWRALKSAKVCVRYDSITGCFVHLKLSFLCHSGIFQMSASESFCINCLLKSNT